MHVTEFQTFDKRIVNPVLCALRHFQFYETTSGLIGVRMNIREITDRMKTHQENEYKEVKESKSQRSSTIEVQG